MQNTNKHLFLIDCSIIFYWQSSMRTDRGKRCVPKNVVGGMMLAIKLCINLNMAICVHLMLSFLIISIDFVQ